MQCVYKPHFQSHACNNLTSKKYTSNNNQSQNYGTTCKCLTRVQINITCEYISLNKKWMQTTHA